MPNDIAIRHVGHGEITDPALVDQIEQLEEQAERDLQAMNVNFRWGREQVAIVKQAARQQATVILPDVNLLIHTYGTGTRL